MPGKVLIVDDNRNLVSTLQLLLTDRYKVEVSYDAENALKLVEAFEPQVAILDILLPGMSGIDLLKEFRKQSLHVVVVMLTIVNNADPAIEAIRSGASHYLVKPFDENQLLAILEKSFMEYDQRWGAILEEKHPPPFMGMIGETRIMRNIFERITEIANHDLNVLITGETGTGKELVAHAIHNLSHRKQGPFITCNSSLLTSEIGTSELFGHEKGAFTGATSQHKGKFEQAQGGTLFLDEISTLPHDTQAKLLRVLEERTITKIGGEASIPVDFRFISATNTNLQQAVESHQFRIDLYHRINTMQVSLPPLRERVDDIPLLVDFFLNKCRSRVATKPKEIDKKTIELLKRLPWEGNVRQLENTILATISSTKKDIITVEDIEIQDLHREPDEEASLAGAHVKGLGNIVARTEKTIIERTLEKFKGDTAQTAKELRINPSTLYRKMKKLGML